jgi:hypothetical protein
MIARLMGSPIPVPLAFVVKKALKKKAALTSARTLAWRAASVRKTWMKVGITSQQ